jgi:thioredoxin-related protein
VKKAFLALAPFLLFCSLQIFSQTEQKKTLEWYTDLMKAQEISKSSNKPIFAFFTGSDWCGWCKKLQNEVFEKPEFIDWAKKNVVLLELDFPRRKQLPPELAQQNANLQEAFQIQGFPTVWLFYLSKDAETNKFNIAALGSLGYPSGAEIGKEEVKFISTANGILANKPK